MAGGRRLWAIEGRRSYGLGLTRYLQAAGETVCEIDLPMRSPRKRGKSDRIDAERAAKEALGQQRLAIPRADGDQEALRILQIKTLVARLAPQLLAEPGVGPLTGAMVLLAWSHRRHLHSEAAFARLAAAAPLEASSGITTRHRLSRLGDRRLNAAVTTIVAIRRRYDQRTRLYVERRSRQPLNDKEINRCLKRHVARHLFRLPETSNHQVEHYEPERW